VNIFQYVYFKFPALRVVTYPTTSIISKNWLQILTDGIVLKYSYEKKWNICTGHFFFFFFFFSFSGWGETESTWYVTTVDLLYRPRMMIMEQSVE
jgi:hypothetical protein